MISAGVAAAAVVRAGPQRLCELRRSPLSSGTEPVPVSLVKHADDQTVAGLAAVLEAVHATAGIDLTHWAIVAAPRFFGRAILAQALDRFAAEGAWGVSPHLVPNRSLHALSGTVSQALKVRGPNFGVGGGPACAAKAMLAAATLLADASLPGVLVVLTGWNAEPGVPEADESAAVCTAVALVLTRGGQGLFRMRLDVATESTTATAGDDLAVEDLADALECSEPGTQLWSLNCGGTLRLVRLDGERGTRVSRVLGGLSSPARPSQSCESVEEPS